MVDTATIGILGGMMTVMLSVIMTVMIYFFKQVDKRFAQVDARFAQVDARFDQIIGIVVDLAKTVGELRGQADVSVPVEALSAAE